MKRFFIKLTVFAVIAVLIDIGFGIYCTRFRNNTTTGRTGADNEATLRTTAPVLVFGSSRARRHYDVRILSDSLDKECYNCGYDSKGIEFFRIRLRQILRRYSPKMIIYEITPLYDLMQTPEPTNFYDALKPWFFDPAVYGTVRRRNFKEWIKCHSATYRYHDELWKMISDRKTAEKIYDGYSPFESNHNVKQISHAPMVPDQNKLAMMESFIEECKSHDVRLIFILSPYYMNDMGDQAAVLRPLASKHAITLIDPLQ